MTLRIVRVFDWAGSFLQEAALLLWTTGGLGLFAELEPLELY